MEELRQDARRNFKKASLRAHPDKGGTNEGFTQVKSDFNIVKRHLNRRTAIGVGVGIGDASTDLKAR